MIKRHLVRGRQTACAAKVSRNMAEISVALNRKQ